MSNLPAHRTNGRLLVPNPHLAEYTRSSVPIGMPVRLRAEGHWLKRARMLRLSVFGQDVPKRYVVFDNQLQFAGDSTNSSFEARPILYYVYI